MVSRKRKQSISNTEFEKIFPKEFIYFRDRSPIDIIKFILFFCMTFDTSNMIERFKQFGGAAPPTAPTPPTAPPPTAPPPTAPPAAGKTPPGKDAGKTPPPAKKEGPKPAAKKEKKEDKKEAVNSSNSSNDEDEDAKDSDLADDTVMAFIKEILTTAKNVALYVINKVSAIFVTLVMWSAYPSIPFFAAMAGMAGVLKYIFWKFRKL